MANKWLIEFLHLEPLPYKKKFHILCVRALVVYWIIKYALKGDSYTQASKCLCRCLDLKLNFLDDLKQNSLIKCADNKLSMGRYNNNPRKKDKIYRVQ